MVRRRSMALSAAGGGLGLSIENGGKTESLGSSYGSEKQGPLARGSSRWSDVPAYPIALAGGGGRRTSVLQTDEERLDVELERARRNSKEQEMGLRRAR
jgi:hypothetical protein